MYRYLVIIVLFILNTAGCAGKTSEGLYQDGVQLLRKGKMDDAVILFKCALEKDHHNLDARYQLARVYLSEKKYGLAEKEFQKVKLMNPHRSDINIDLATIHLEQGEIEKARFLIEGIIKHASTNKRVVDLLAKIDVTSGKNAEVHPNK